MWFEIKLDFSASSDKTSIQLIIIPFTVTITSTKSADAIKYQINFVIYFAMSMIYF